ncbi:hypothetical protein GCM10027299_21860 [Larkinella ripae]
MKLEALTRITGSYGVANKGDIIVVLDETGEQLIEAGLAKKSSKGADDAEPEEVSERNLSGIPSGEPVQLDGTLREKLNTEGRKLHEAPGDIVNDEQVKIEEAVKDELPPVQSEKADKEASDRKTKEDKEAAKKDSK